MNKKLKLQLILRNKTEGALSEIEIFADIHAPKEMSEHDLAGILFACEFAINGHAAADFGDIRTHVSYYE